MTSMVSPMKRSAELASLRALSTMGLPAELFISTLLEMLHRIIPSLRNLFDWTDSKGNLIRYYFEGEIDHAVAAHYFAEFHNRKEADVMPTFQQAVTGRSIVLSAQQLDNSAFYRSGLYNEIWRPQGLHTRIEAIVKGSHGQPLGSLVLYRGKKDRCFTKANEILLGQVARYVRRGLEVPTAGIVAGNFVPRKDRHAMLSLNTDGQLLHLSGDAVRLLLMAQGGVTPENVSRPPKRDDFPILTMLLQQHLQASFLSQDAVRLSVDNAWGRFTFESVVLTPLASGTAPLIHVTIQQSEPIALSVHRAIDALPLTPSQREVCILLYNGGSTAEIASALNIARSTVADHIKKVYARLDVHSTLELTKLINERIGAPRS
jgi:DNA-binding CsgD family transcriptional regulator